MAAPSDRAGTKAPLGNEMGKKTVVGSPVWYMLVLRAGNSNIQETEARGTALSLRPHGEFWASLGYSVGLYLKLNRTRKMSQ